MTRAVKPRLLFVVNVAWFFLSHRSEIARAAVAHGYEVHLAADVDSPEDAAAVAALGVTLHRIPVQRGGMNPLADLRYMASLWRLLRELRPTVIHAVTAKPVLYGGLAARATGARRFVAALSGLGYAFTGERAASPLSRLVGKALALALAGPGCRVILQNPDDLEQVVAARIVSREKACLIRGSGVDLDRFAFQPESSPPGPMRVVLAARMLRDKGVIEFAEAAAIVRRRLPQVEFQLAGSLDPDNPSRLSREQIAGLESGCGVTWLGPVTDVAALYAAATVVCLPSYREGLPKALLEACAVGRAIVTTDVPGCREVVRHGHNGLLVPARNAEALAAALVELLENPAMRRGMGANARQLAVDEFDVRAVVRKTLDVYGDGGQ